MKLIEYLEQQGLDIKAFAFYNGVDEKTVHNWIKGRSRPMKIYQHMVEKVTNGQVTAEDWDNGQKTTDNRKRSTKDNGRNNSKRLDVDKKAKPKVGNGR